MLSMDNVIRLYAAVIARGEDNTRWEDAFDDAISAAREFEKLWREFESNELYKRQVGDA